jgi:hypothetical protein
MFVRVDSATQISPTLFCGWKSSTGNNFVMIMGTYQQPMSGMCVGTETVANPITWPFTWQANHWYHVAASRKNGVVYGFVDGVKIGQASLLTNFGTTPGCRIGTDTAGNGAAGWTFLNGYLDEVRVSKTARYTANFTPPIVAFRG